MQPQSQRCHDLAEHAGFEPAGRLRDHGLASRCLGPLGQCSSKNIKHRYCHETVKNRAVAAAYLSTNNVAPREGLEPSTIGFGGRCAAIAPPRCKNWQGRRDSNLQPTGSKPVAPPLSYSPIIWSGWVDSNHRPLASKARTLTGLRYIQKKRFLSNFQNWCPRGESNSQNLASKASMSASSITRASCTFTSVVSSRDPHPRRTGVAAQGGQSMHIQPRRLCADRKGRGAKAHPK